MSPRSSFDELLCSCSSTDVSIYAQFCGSVLWNETVISGEIMVNQWDLEKKKKKQHMQYNTFYTSFYKIMNISYV